MILTPWPWAQDYGRALCPLHRLTSVLQSPTSRQQTWGFTLDSLHCATPMQGASDLCSIQNRGTPTSLPSFGDQGSGRGGAQHLLSRAGLYCQVSWTWGSQLSVPTSPSQDPTIASPGANPPDLLVSGVCGLSALARSGKVCAQCCSPQNLLQAGLGSTDPTPRGEGSTGAKVAGLGMGTHTQGGRGVQWRNLEDCGAWPLAGQELGTLVLEILGQSSGGAGSCVGTAGRLRRGRGTVVIQLWRVACP